MKQRISEKKKELLYKKYPSILNKIKYMPEYNKEKAIARFALIIEFEKFEKDKRRELKEKYRVKRQRAEFAKSKKLSPKTLRTWLNEYKNKGIIGLVPLYGKGRTEEKKDPEEIKTVECTIKIDVKRPLKSLFELRDIILNNELIDRDAAIKAAISLNKQSLIYRRKSPVTLHRPLTKEEIGILEKHKAGQHKGNSRRATALLMLNEGCSLEDAIFTTKVSPGTIRNYRRNFKKRGISFVEVKVEEKKRKEAFKEKSIKVIDIIHKLPLLYGINRTSWTKDTIIEAYEKTYDEKLSNHAIKAILKEAGYKWGRAKQVLMSHDPEYKEKIEKVLSTIQNIKENEAFFFIDEAGPWRVMKYGGQQLKHHNDEKPVQEVIVDKGKVNFIAALEAITNQVTFLFIKKRSSSEIIALLEEIKKQYFKYNKIYLTWDALTVHNSLKVKDWIKENNMKIGVPPIQVVPLPSRAQFLNVIEAVIGGLKKAVINNSDYKSKEDMKYAISRHFEERNEFFKKNPKRAGNKIWEKGTVKIEELPGGLYRRM